ncbi:MAG: hypothetical protein ACP5VP_02405 [Candidatus Limnocylindrales bacterium]
MKMLKRELVWRQLADDVLTSQRPSFHQTTLAAELGMSLGNVNLALEPLRAIGAVEVVGKNLVVRDVKKILMLWAARRSPEPPVAAYASLEPARSTIRLLPPGLALTSYAGFIARYHEEPAPFAVIRGYARPGDNDVLSELERRFSPVPTGQATIVVYSADAQMAQHFPEIVSPAQMFVDLWSEADFFASDYLRVLEGRLRL